MPDFMWNDNNCWDLLIDLPVCCLPFCCCCWVKDLWHFHTFIFDFWAIIPSPVQYMNFPTNICRESGSTSEKKKSGSLKGGWNFPFAHEMWASGYDITTRVCDFHGRYVEIKDEMRALSSRRPPTTVVFTLLKNWNLERPCWRGTNTHDSLGVPNRTPRATVWDESRLSPSSLDDRGLTRRDRVCITRLRIAG